MVKERKNICYAYRIWKRNAHLGTLVTSDFHSEKDTKSKDISDEVFLELLTLCIKTPNIVRRATR